MHTEEEAGHGNCRAGANANVNACGQSSPRPNRDPKPETALSTGANPGSRKGARRMNFLFLFLTIALAAGCQDSRPEKFALPYGKKKYEAGFWQPPQWQSLPSSLPGPVFDSLSKLYPRVQSPEDFPPFSVMAHALDSNLHVKEDWRGFAAFFWLQSPSFAQEKNYWLKKERETGKRYMDALRWKKPCRKASLAWDGLNLQAGEGLSCLSLKLETGQAPETGTGMAPLALRLFFREESLAEGENPLVLVPYHREMETYAVPPETFFDQGGILAIAGSAQEKPWQDSSRFFSARDSLFSLAVRADSLSRLYRWRVYRNFLRDSTLHKGLIQEKQAALIPQLTEEQVLKTVDYLISNLYATPGKIAMIVQGQNALACERLLWKRGELFRAVFLQIPADSLLAPLWADFPAKAANHLQYPAILADTGASHAFLLAFLQEKNGRLCGEKPVLSYPAPDWETLWKFLLYQIGHEEGWVKTR